MIDIACIFTTGGVILFYKAFVDLKFDPIDLFIKNILVNERTSETEYRCNPYMVKWWISNELGIIFCVAYQNLFPILYVDVLLQKMEQQFRDNLFKNIIFKKGIYLRVPDYSDHYKNAERQWNKYILRQKKNASIQKSFE